MKNTEKYDRIRKQLSHKYKITEQVFMNDKVLQNIKKEKPISIEQLLMIDGISEDFLIKYGTEWIAISNASKTKPTQKNSSPSSSSTVEDTMNLVKSGKSIKQIAEIRELKPMTIENHICSYWGDNPEEVDAKYIDINPIIVEEIIKAKNKAGDVSKLTPVMNLVEIHVTWCQLKFVLQALNNTTEDKLLQIVSNKVK